MSGPDTHLYRSRLDASLPEVRERIAIAAGRGGRDPESVRVVAVTKEHGVEAIEAALEAGIADLGENRVERIEKWVGELGPEVARWHMIGHLQRRKAGRTREVSTLLHSLDSVRLGERLEEVATEGDAPFPVLVQVNTSGEATKGGFSPDEFWAGLERLLQLPTLRVEGLMTMAPFTQDEKVIRRTFSTLRALHGEAGDRLPAYEGTELSMGMSNDFEIAVEEGSTMVRLGTILLGERRG
ncbi:MAG: YggS family pyridoxal phosphate-dependent enzyme [Gemmatimonadota bacterium]